MRLWRFFHLLAVGREFRMAWIFSREGALYRSGFQLELEKARELWRSLRLMDNGKAGKPLMVADLRRIRKRLTEMAS